MNNEKLQVFQKQTTGWIEVTDSKETVASMLKNRFLYRKRGLPPLMGIDYRIEGIIFKVTLADEKMIPELLGA